jgi:hypothetical protein
MQPHHWQIVVDILHTTPVSYLDELSYELFLRSGLIVSSSTISILLHKHGYTHQRLTRLHRAALPAARVMFREKLRAWVDDLDQLVFVDETSKDRRSINRGYGWGPKNRSVINKGFTLTGKRVSIVGAYSNKGLLSFDITPDTFNAGRFEVWFGTVLLHHLNPYPQENSIVVLDGARYHNRAALRALCHAVGARIFFLPAYSPDLNPIEHFWGVVKSYLRRHGGAHLGHDNDQTLFVAALEHADAAIDHQANLRSCGWVLDQSGQLDRWALLDTDQG